MSVHHLSHNNNIPITRLSYCLELHAHISIMSIHHLSHDNNIPITRSSYCLEINVHISIMSVHHLSRDNNILITSSSYCLELHAHISMQHLLSRNHQHTYNPVTLPACFCKLFTHLFSSTRMTYIPTILHCVTSFTTNPTHLQL